MIAIKGMEMPNACTSTQEIRGHIRGTYCPLYNICKHRDTIRTNYKPSNCPLVEIVTCKECVKGHKYNNVEECYCDYLRDDVDVDFYCPEGKRRE